MKKFVSTMVFWHHMPLGSLAIEIENCNSENNDGAILSNDSSIKKIIEIETFLMEKLLK